ncbi:MAG: DUF1836 domain-containing protein [Erysipelotrichaceae bacterium]|nr:DUF1836 domain-containing protein [Erysipelotrichaceae bacterium]
MSVQLIPWDEIPDFPLYIDQVVAIIDSTLDFLPRNEGDKTITNTMINNYVKAGIVPAPEKKRYTRNHVAYFIVICLLKRVYSLDEISKLFRLQILKSSTEIAYKKFCSIFEYYINNEDDVAVYVEPQHHDRTDLFIKVIRSVVFKVRVQMEITDEMTLQEERLQEKKARKVKKKTEEE